MKTFLTIFLSFLLTMPGFSQLKTKVVKKKKGTYTYTYHKNGKLSTEVYWPKDSNQNGFTSIFSNNGINIYKKENSRRNVISSVVLTYYENGAVKSAEYSWHPDGGIQWGKEKTLFDEQGKITGVENRSHEDFIRPRMLEEKFLPPVVKEDTIVPDPCDSLESLDYGPFADSVVENMFRKWHQTEFIRIHTKHKIKKVSCAGCTLLIADLQIEIDNQGKVKIARFISGTACGQDMSEAMAKDITESISKMVFPKQCYNRCFEKRVGRALKC